MKRLFSIISLSLLISIQANAMMQQQEEQTSSATQAGEAMGELIGTVIALPFKAVWAIGSAACSLVGSLMAAPTPPDDPNSGKGSNRNLSAEARDNLRAFKASAERGRLAEASALVATETEKNVAQVAAHVIAFRSARSDYPGRNKKNLSPALGRARYRRHCREIIKTRSEI